MASYIERELPGLITSELPADGARQSIMGHSMGGHGALTIALRNQDRYASVSAFSPISSPMNCQWGQKALSGYLGSNKESWRRYDACALLQDGARVPELLVDQGAADQFLATQLKPELLQVHARGWCAANLAHARRLRPFLLFHFYVYRGPPPLARAAARQPKPLRKTKEAFVLSLRCSGKGHEGCYRSCLFWMRGGEATPLPRLFYLVVTGQADV